AAKATYFQEYIVREGDTINSVAIKFKVNAQELALVNNKEPNETLIAGQRLLIPRN
ncbi:MAG: LysM peptidoglycan-binding domain-containing protein, partial [Saprospiraceae bacterium]|nr:LysM peptidoglycan-binding domain-containing protein [Saprospiraceae bacterium]